MASWSRRAGPSSGTTLDLAGVVMPGMEHTRYFDDGAVLAISCLNILNGAAAARKPRVRHLLDGVLVGLGSSLGHHIAAAQQAQLYRIDLIPVTPGLHTISTLGIGDVDSSQSAQANGGYLIVVQFPNWADDSEINLTP